MADVPVCILALLARGEIETVNLMEWLAADMPALARALSRQDRQSSLRRALAAVASEMESQSITNRLKTAGRAIAASVPAFDAPDFLELATHKCDLVRQWACYAVNDQTIRCDLKTRLTRTLPFAADHNMSVRETAWMAFRPHLAAQVTEGLRLLKSTSRSNDENWRRFAIEVTRPRSVWGAHIPELKRSPNVARLLLENVKKDSARYVQLAVGNWLNDASKSRPDWVAELCARWMVEEHLHTRAIVKRALRTISRRTQMNDDGWQLAVDSVPAGPNLPAEGGFHD